MPKENYQSISGFQISSHLYQFIEQEVLPGIDITSESFFDALVGLISELSGENQSLLDKRDQLQAKIDAWHRENPDEVDLKKYKEFLQHIHYLLPKPKPFDINLDQVDDEIAKIAGPQLVVPASNARFVLNAVNARWGSLYDTLYGTNAIANEGQYKITSALNPKRAEKVIAWANKFLDEVAPLKDASFAQVVSIEDTTNLVFNLNNGEQTVLSDTEAFVGTTDKGVLLRHHQLHIELVIDKHTSGIVDVLLESAITTIVDLEDSVATVSIDEKIDAYRNFLGLMKRDLKAKFNKNGKPMTRSINADKHFKDQLGKSHYLPATSLTLVRNVGHHMFTDLVLDKKGQEVPEGIVDAMVTSLIAIHDIKHLKANSKCGNLYIVKPKMHGPEEVAFSVKLFAKVEQLLGLRDNTLKIGIMDEERRTSVNLAACIKAASKRVIFINTGFLDRTGDEIHTSMYAGPMPPKDEIKQQAWIHAYEALNVKTGLDCGMYKNAQIGKGMWAQPDQMAQMLETKIAHLQAGANCAWVPSPTAATLHATHYHRFDVFAKQQELLQKDTDLSKDDLLVLPLLKTKLTDEQIQFELDNNAQGILGYVVRWIDQGVGCSKVKDINHVGLMEDRATLRISSQHIANWLHHGLCTKDQVEKTFKAMAKVVDKQNQDDPFYKKISPKYDGLAFKAALALVFQGVKEPNGYTETTLRQYRQQALKASQK